MEAGKPQKTRIPEPVDNIQVNFCKNPSCTNFGVPASLNPQPRGPGSEGKERDTYTISRGRVGYALLKCDVCGETPPLKSNSAIGEELTRLKGYLALAHRIEVTRIWGVRSCFLHFKHFKRLLRVTIVML